MNRAMLARMRTAIAVVVLAVATIIPQGEGALAQTPAYVGTWGSQPAQCRLGQDQQDAPMIIKRDGYDQHETHCKFSSVRAKGLAWTVKAKCTVEGDTQNPTLVLRASGNRLTIRDEAGTRTLQRCP
jgi:hypothetical protein